MAAAEDVDRFLHDTAGPWIADQLPPETKDALAALLDSRGPDVLATALDGAVPGTITAASPDELAAAVADLVADQEPNPAHQDPGPGDPADPADPIGSDDPEEIAAELAAALGQDGTELVECYRGWIAEQVVAALWADVRPQLDAEIAGHPEVWGTAAAAKAAAFEAGYAAMAEAVEGLCEAAEAEGGVAALLARAQY